MTTTDTAAWIAGWASCAGIIAIGTRFLVAPTAAAAGYGVEPPVAADPYLAVKGVRDIGTGLIGMAVLASAQRRIGARTLLAAAAIPASDAAIVRTRGGSPAIAYGVHGVTAAVLIACGAILLRRTGITQG